VWLRDDILQETALRLFTMWDRVDGSRSPCGLALTIAHNLLWDEQHRKARGEVLGVLPDLPCEQDVERSGIAREELGRVYRLLPRLTAKHRSVLLAEIGGPEPVTSTSDALKMLRMRARRRLTALMEGASAGIFVTGFELRRLGWRVSSAVRRHSIPAELPAGAIVAICGVVAVLMVPLQAMPEASAGTSADKLHAVGESAMAVGGGPRVGQPKMTTLAAPRTIDRRGRGSNPVRPAGDGYHFSVGDEGPVEGEAGLQILPKDGGDDALQPPGCHVGRPRETEIVVSCTAHVPDREMKVLVRIAARP
jgi:hypothetical protein